MAKRACLQTKGGGKIFPPLKALLIAAKLEAHVVLALQRKRVIAQVLDLEAVFLVFLVVKGLQFVDGQFMEFIEVMPPLVARAQFGAQIGVGDIAAHLRGDVEGAHGGAGGSAR